MTSIIRWLRTAAVGMLLALTVCLPLATPVTAADALPWPASSVVYCVFPAIFSPQGNFAGVTAQLPRLKALGVSVVWLMPVTPVGQPINGHPAFGSPYAVHDYYAVNPAYGTQSDLRTLVTTAHKLGLKVILDQVLNHTAWDSPLTTQHPEFYVHSDGNPNNPASIRQAFNYGDVAQLDYANAGLRTYMIQMLQSWMTQYGVDGFRFDSADNPGGPNRMIPADFWQEMGRQLRQTKPDVLLLGECETPDLALKPFGLDYGWHVYDAVRDAANGGDASHVRDAWGYQTDNFPPGMRHMSLQDNWDKDRDLAVFAGAAGAQAAAVFNFTVPGVPLIYNGMEVGNAGGSVNPHTPIDWASGDPRFPPLYRQLTALRLHSPALQQGSMNWLDNSLPSQVLTYERIGGGQEYLVEINLSTRAANGTVQVPNGPTWAEVPLAGLHGSGTHAAPPHLSLQPKEFAMFRRPHPPSVATPRKENTRMNRTLLTAAVAATTLLLPLTGHAQTTIASDNAGNYGGPGQPAFSGGANSGSGFQPFQLTNGKSSGFFLSTSNENGDKSGPGIDSPNKTNGNKFAFGEYANTNDTASATRPFNKALSVGQTFSAEFDNGTVAVGSYVDFGLGNASGLLYQFTFAGGNIDYFFNSVDTKIVNTYGGLVLSFTRTDATHYSFTATSRANPAQKFTQTGMLTGDIDRVNIFNHNAGMTSAPNLYFNNLKITGPAP